MVDKISRLRYEKEYVTRQFYTILVICNLLLVSYFADPYFYQSSKFNAVKKILAELLTIGDEILYGQIVDTNSQWMSVELDKVGIKVVRKTTVGDLEDEILIAFAEAEKRADVVLITGGLGPTSDDRTKPCLAKYFNCEMKINEEALAEVTEFFKSRGRELTELNRLQASLPTACEKITNPVGTAPGMWFNKGDKVLMSMPGVPHEMKRMMTEQVIPRLSKKYQLPVIHHKIIRTIGLGESFLAEKIADWEKGLPEHIKLAYLPSLGEVKLRLTGFGSSLNQLETDTNRQIENLKGIVGQFIYGYGEEPIEVVIGKLLREKKLTLSIAESCTGGYLSHMITSVPGSSEYFLGTMIPYAYEIKMRQLGVKPEILEKYGAVSEPTIIEMANIVRAKFSTDIGVATSGIAGPGGATPDKPVGTVWIAYSDKHHTVTKKLQLSKDRMINIRMASMAVLNLIRQSLPK
jgi:nicotinamide-nucleotide amidase